MMHRFLFLIIMAGIASLLLFCDKQSADWQKAAQNITVEALLNHIKILASDEFQGRGPSTAGEEKTLAYLKEQFRQMGVKPGNGDSYFQEVPLVELTADPNMPLTIERKGEKIVLSYGTDFIAATRQVQERITLKNTPLIFVGYGINAPEYGWNDYEGLDVKGKTVVMLVNDPGYATGDSTLFNGKSMTYYGRWTYKYEEAARQGAAAAIIIHETGAAGYPWGVVQNSWSGPQYHLVTADKNMSRCKAEGWVTNENARKIFQMAGLDLEQLATSAAQRGFRARPMGITASLTIRNTIRYATSHNVVALLPGSDRANEYIVYTAHWDHFGVNPALKPDSILNGARDNATGVSALLEIARSFSRLPRLPLRSIVFLAVTAEEQGLLGSEYYANHPLYPLAQTVANINMDAMNIFGKTKDITVVGYGNSELDDLVEEVAKEQGRYVRPDPEPEKGYYYRSDHFNLAKKGVPAIYTKVGIDHVDHGEQWMLEKLNWWTENHYHKPSDEYDPDYWNLSGMVDDTQLLFAVGYKLSNSDQFPNWREGNEFRAIRDASRAEMSK